MNKENHSVTQKIVEKWGARKDCLIEVLHDVQEECNYLPREILTEVSEELEVPLSRIFEIATFYKGFSLKPRGRFWIEVCMGTACHVQGADIILEAFERELGIKVGEMDENMDFSLDVVRCVGCCGLAPVVTINRDIYGKFGPGQVSAIIEKYRSIPKKKVDIEKKYKEIKRKMKTENG
ncbi:NADP-reducing hydrogenase subunit HndA [subsurface metagenome]